MNKQPRTPPKTKTQELLGVTTQQEQDQATELLIRLANSHTLALTAIYAPRFKDPLVINIMTDDRTAFSLQELCLFKEQINIHLTRLEVKMRVDLEKAELAKEEVHEPEASTSPDPAADPADTSDDQPGADAG